MKKFKYRAESYLKFLEHDRENALKLLKEAEIYKIKLEEQYTNMENKVMESYQMNTEIGQEGRDVHFINDNNQFIQMLKVQQKNLSLEIQMAEEELQRHHQALMDIQLKVKKIELHKELEKEKYKKEIKVKSQKITDEINSTRQRGRDAKSV